MSVIDTRPDNSETADYYRTYIDQVPEGSILALLESQLVESLALLAAIDDEQALHRYAPEKWSVKEVWGHVTDVERIFSLRGLCFARNEPSHLFGMEQDDYVQAADFDARSLSSIAEEFEHLRRANRALFASLSDEELLRRGTASDCEFSVRSIPYILAGHELHHRKVLRDKYWIDAQQPLDRRN